MSSTFTHVLWFSMIPWLALILLRPSSELSRQSERTLWCRRSGLGLLGANLLNFYFSVHLGLSRLGLTTRMVPFVPNLCHFFCAQVLSKAPTKLMVGGPKNARSAFDLWFYPTRSAKSGPWNPWAVSPVVDPYLQAVANLRTQEIGRESLLMLNSKSNCGIITWDLELPLICPSFFVSLL